MSNEGFTLEKYYALQSAIAEGALRVKYSDKEVEYRSLNEMERILRMMESKLCLNKPKGGKKGLFGGRRINAITSKGLD